MHRPSEFCQKMGKKMSHYLPHQVIVDSVVDADGAVLAAAADIISLIPIIPIFMAIL